MRNFVRTRRGALAARLTALLLTVVAVCTSAVATPQEGDGRTPTVAAEGQAAAAAPRRVTRRVKRCRCRHRGRRHCKRHRRARRHASRRSKARRASYLSALYRRLRGTKPPRGARLAQDTVCFRHGRHHVVVYPDGGFESLCELPGARIWVTALPPAEATDGGDTSTEPCLPPRALAPTGQARARGRGFERTPGGYRSRLYIEYAAPTRRRQNSPARFHWRAHVASARLVLAPA